MYISKKHRFVYIGIPKTASTALHRFFPGVMGQNDLDGGALWQHRTGIPAWATGFRVVVSVREPMQRLRSLWRHSQTSGRKRELIPEWTFLQFVTAVQRRQGLTPFYTRTQESYLAASDDWTLWRMDEQIPEIDGMTVPVINRTRHRDIYPVDNESNDDLANSIASELTSCDTQLWSRSVKPTMRGIIER